MTHDDQIASSLRCVCVCVCVCVCGVIRASRRLEQLSSLQLKRHTTEQIEYTRARRVVGIVVVYNTTCKTYR